ncbi:hypothetical protein PICMEDRAFT_11771 [Pichia membranifaciens NRRL Y-2026]|uniref:Protein kinase domain-containing protein n=1 Tax=Pichia membranifaciens NRRL Y-2026 TaxID=763406 RepID=A0A1E3NKX2_9ASCO|nr:hypothetical protein PICMEDRAFT_11771 [Pichia membranifaciens NRRL Y-2026]ODQ46802.1 hypothetical protein PICMEDRAFT_11771 [Pichia membranifaciens NRRL Y-2026]
MDALGWKPLAKIGGGRFSDIYRVLKSDSENNSANNEEQQLFALKLVDPDDEKPPHNIRNEIKILSDLKNAKEGQDAVIPNVINLISVSSNNIEYGLLFPLLDMTLNHVIKSHIKSRTIFNSDGTMKMRKVNTIPIDSAFKIVVGLMKGLDWIHKNGVIHRDINPNNILFGRENPEMPVIIDFGISYQEPYNNGLEKPNKKFTDIATGIYKAPELLLSKRDYSNKVDMWAVGILITVILSKDGKPIFEQDSMYSDLVLLSNILATFGSPPSDWSDCKGLTSFDSLNRTFFTKSPKPLEEIVPRLFEEPETLSSSKLQKTITGLTKYETSERLSAHDALAILLC